MFKAIFKSSFFKNVSVLVIGTISAQLISIGIQPILKRLFEPEIFGAFDIYLKILGILSVIFPLSYSYGIVIPKRKSSAVNIFYAVVILSLIFFLISEVLVLCFYSELLKYLKFPLNYGYALYILPLSALFFTFSSSITYLLIRDKKFNSLSITKIGRRSSEGVVQLIGGYIGKSSGLFIGDLIGNFVCFLISIKSVFQTLKFWNKHYSLRVFKSVFVKYFYISKSSFLPMFFNTLAISSITFTVLYKFDLLSVGYLELTQKILIVPTALVGTAVSQIILEQVSTARQNSLSCYRKVLFVSILLTCISIPFLIIILMWGEKLFGLIFGVGWSISGFYAEILIYGTIASFIVSPLSSVLIGLDKFKINALWMYMRVGLYIILFLTPFKDLENYLFWYMITEVIVYLLYLVIIVFSILKYEKNLMLHQ